MRRPLIVLSLALAAVAVAGAAAAFTSGGDGAPAGRRTVPAPIDDLEVLIRESAPPQVSVRITAGLPNGCAQRDTHSVGRNGDTITITVLNSVPSGSPACTTIYGTYGLVVDLGTDFRAGGTYVLRVNDRSTTFRT